MSKISQYILIWKENSHFFLKMCYDEENGGDEMEYKEHNYELIKEYWNRYVAGYEEMPEHLEGLDDRVLNSWKRSKSKANPFETNPPLLNQVELFD